MFRCGRRFRVVWAMLLLFCGACVASVPNNTGGVQNYDSQKLLELGEKMLLAGNTAQALKYLVSALEKAPNDPVVHYDLGLAYNARGLRKKAVEHFQQAIAVKPDYPEAHNAMGAIYAEENRLDEAEQSFQRALSDPFYRTPFYALFNMGRVQEKRGEWEEALNSYEQATQLLPSYGSAYYRKGLVLEALKRPLEARFAYGKALQFDPNSAEAHYSFARLSYEAGDMRSAEHSFKRVIKLAPYSSLADSAGQYLDQIQNGSIDAPSVHRPDKESILKDISRLQEQIDRKAARRGKTAAEAAAVPAPVPLPEAQGSPTGEKTAEPEPLQAKGTEVQEAVAVKERMIEPSVMSIPDQAKADATASQQPAVEDISVAASRDAQWRYFIQLYSFKDPTRADAAVEKLKARGYDALTRVYPHKEFGEIHAVYLQPVDSLDKAEALIRQLEEREKTKPVLIKIPAGRDSS